MAKKRTRNKRRTMKGGAFTQSELDELSTRGFSQDQIKIFQYLGASFNEITQKINLIKNQREILNPYDISEQVMVELLNEYIFENPNVQHLDTIPHSNDDQHDLDLDQSFQSQGSLHLSDLNTSQDSLHMSDLDTSKMSGYTTNPDNSFGEVGGKKRRRYSKKRVTKKGRKTLKQRGGMCFGNGLGANSYDPNYSIYNTNILKLFPYKPMN
jgi:hypothetical protein